MNVPSATVAEAEQLLSTTYNVYEHNSGAVHVGCDSYSVPAHVSSHIDLITPTVHFDRRLEGASAPMKKRLAPGHQGVGAPGAGIVVPQAAGKIKNIIDELENCDVHITPNCLRALYGLVYAPLAAKKNSYGTMLASSSSLSCESDTRDAGIVEYTPQAYLQSDLDMFYRNFSPSHVGQKPNLISVDGGFAQTTEKDFGVNGESDLDIQYGQTLVGSLPITLFQVGDE
jgi:tripeptidyl-peptidase-1